MATQKKTVKAKSNRSSVVESKISYLDRIESEVQSNQSKVSLILGALILVVVVILIFNYFNRNKSEVGPAGQTSTTQSGDVSPENLPGKYTVKDGDTLFTLAEKYYTDGYKYTEIAKANNLVNVDSIVAGQVLDIPKLDQELVAQAPASPTQTPAATPTPAPSSDNAQADAASWGTPISDNTYTVVEGDWLSTIAARAYKGDVMAYQKIAIANNISNPDVIEPGMVLTLPR